MTATIRCVELSVAEDSSDGEVEARECGDPIPPKIVFKTPEMHFKRKGAVRSEE